MGGGGPKSIFQPFKMKYPHSHSWSQSSHFLSTPQFLILPLFGAKIATSLSTHSLGRYKCGIYKFPNDDQMGYVFHLENMFDTFVGIPFS